MFLNNPALLLVLDPDKYHLAMSLSEVYGKP